MITLKVSDVELISTVYRMVLGTHITLNPGHYEIAIRVDEKDLKSHGFVITKTDAKSKVLDTKTLTSYNACYGYISGNDCLGLYGDDYNVYTEFYNIWHEAIDIKYSKDDDTTTYWGILSFDHDTKELVKIMVF